MELVTARIFFSTMITAIPTLMSLCMIALFAFPRTRANWIKDTKLYYGSMYALIFIVGLSMVTIILIIEAFVKIDSINGKCGYLLYEGTLVNLSIISLLLMPFFLLCYLGVIAYVESK